MQSPNRTQRRCTLTDDLLEVVDAEGRCVGLEPRSRCHSDPSLRHRSVHIVVRNAGGEVLLQKRSASKDVMPGRWDTSVGGHLAPGESYEAAALRELREELGIALDDASALVHLRDYIWQSGIETELVRTFGTTHEGPFSPDPAEVDEVRFVSPDELRIWAEEGLLTPNLVCELGCLGIMQL
jgi:isopentenyldiphosphate isomerase